jgi:hypothetical protein
MWRDAIVDSSSDGSHAQEVSSLFSDEDDEIQVDDLGLMADEEILDIQADPDEQDPGSDQAGSPASDTGERATCRARGD